MFLRPFSVLLLSSFIGILWLFFIPFVVVQTCIDKVLIQGDLNALIVISTIAAIVFFFASGLDLVLSTLAAKISNSKTSQISLQWAVELPRILISLAAMLFYNVKFAVVACLIIALGNSVFYFLKFRQKTRKTSLDKQIKTLILGTISVSFRILLSFTTLFIFLYGINLVIQYEMTLGELAGFILLSIQLAISVPNIISSIIQPTPV